MTAEGRHVWSFRSLLDHLATLTRNDLRYGTDTPTIPTLAEPTPLQRRAFERIDRSIPLPLKQTEQESVATANQAGRGPRRSAPTKLRVSAAQR